MKRTACSAALAVLTALAVLPGRADDSAEPVFRRVSASVVTLLAFDEQGRESGQGSAVAVGPGRLASNCHLVREAHSLKAVSGETRLAATWILADPSRDLCLIEAPGLAAPAPATRRLDDIAVGETAHALGNPLGFGLSVSSGLVSGIVTLRGERVIVTSAPLSPGSSGGGLFDAEGRLLGITTAILGAGQNFNLVLPAGWLAELERRGVAPAPVTVPGPEPRWLEEATALVRANAMARLESHARSWRQEQPDAAPAAAHLGLALQGQGRHGEAEAVLREAVRLDPGSEHAWRLLAQSLRAQSRRDEAEAALDRAQALLPSAPGPHSLRGAWRLDERRFDAARTEAREAIRLGAGESGHWRLLGQAEDGLGNAGAAAKAYGAALRLAPADPALRQALAQALARQGSVDEARLAIGQDGGAQQSNGEVWLVMGQAELGRKRYAAAEGALRKAVEAAPDMAKAWAALGVVLAETGRNAEAIKQYDRALALPSVAPGLAAEILANRAVARHRLGNSGAALEDARRAVALDPTAIGALRLIGIVETAGHRHAQALEAFRKVVALAGAGADDWASLGELLEKSGDRAAALPALEKAETLDAGNARALLLLAGYHGRGGDLPRALGYLDRALAIDSANPAPWSSKGYALLKMGRPEEAVAALQTAVGLDPQFANAWINLGEAHLRGGRHGEAIRALEKALALVPTALDARLFLAQSYLATRQAKKAGDMAESVLQRLSGQPDALGVAVLAHLMAGRKEEAAQRHRQLRAVNPQIARTVRAKAIAAGLKGAADLPE